MRASAPPATLTAEQSTRLGLLVLVSLFVYVLHRSGETLELTRPKLVALEPDKQEEAVQLLAGLLRGRTR